MGWRAVLQAMFQDMGPYGALEGRFGSASGSPACPHVLRD